MLYFFFSHQSLHIDNCIALADNDGMANSARYQKLVARATADRDAAIASADEQYRKRMEAIRVIWEMENGEDAESQHGSEDPPTDSSADALKRGDLATSVR